MKIKVGIVQDSPIFFDKAKTIQKLEALVKENKAKGCQLLVFPESFIPGYPRGFTFGANVGKRTHEGKVLYRDYHNSSVNLNGPDVKKLEKIASSNSVFLVIGITEKTDINGSLYCSMLYISPTMGLLGVHRKIKPTGTERIIWAEGAAKDLVTVNSKFGILGGLICWENYMPLARMSMYTKGVEIYIAPTADARPSWITSMIHIALEGRCFVLSSNQYFTKSMYPKKYQHLVKEENEDMCRGGSVIISPNGNIIAGPLYDQSGTIIAEIDTADIIASKLDFDINGHYSRNDIFEFNIPGQPTSIDEE